MTIELLKINDPFRVEFREELMAEKLFPQGDSVGSVDLPTQAGASKSPATWNSG